MEKLLVPIAVILKMASLIILINQFLISNNQFLTFGPKAVLQFLKENCLSTWDYLTNFIILFIGKILTCLTELGKPDTKFYMTQIFKSNIIMNQLLENISI